MTRAMLPVYLMGLHDTRPNKSSTLLDFSNPIAYLHTELCCPRRLLCQLIGNNVSDNVLHVGWVFP